jgi:ribose-phosphate pyrophosphokinase
MTNDAAQTASVRILELNLAEALEKVYTSKSLPVSITASAPREGGLCDKIFDALEKRATFDRADLYAKNTMTLFAQEKKLVFNCSLMRRMVFVVLDFPKPDPKIVSPEFALLSNALLTDAYIALAQEAGMAAKHTGEAKEVHLIMPNYAYARQDKAHGELGPISAAITAQNLEPYYDSVTSVHLHAPAIQGMFRAIPLRDIAPTELHAPSFIFRDPKTFEPISPDALTIDGINQLFGQICVVSPDAGGAKNARDFAKYCKKFAATVLGESEDLIVDLPMAQIDKRRAGANVSEVMNVLGKENVANRIAVIVDDMLDTFGTGIHAADALIAAGARKVEALETHGYFSGSALERLSASNVSRVAVTNSTALKREVLESDCVDVIDIAPVLAQVIIDKITKPDSNITINRRHLVGPDLRGKIGRYSPTMF